MTAQERIGAIRIACRAAATTVAVPVVALGVIGCGSSAGHLDDSLLMQRPPDSVTVTTRSVPDLGPILTDGHGYVLYMFPPDARSRVSCEGACAGTWPPLALTGGHPRPGAGVSAAELGTLPDPNTGARVVTYAGNPLYRYAGDVRPGTANGQALFNHGGPWYVLDPDGRPVTIDPNGG